MGHEAPRESSPRITPAKANAQATSSVRRTTQSASHRMHASFRRAFDEPSALHAD